MGAAKFGLRGSVVAAMLMFTAPAVASADLVVNFDSRSAGTVLASQDENLGGAGHGVVFGQAPFGSAREPVVTNSVSRSAPNSVYTCTCHGEFSGSSDLWGRFDRLKSHVQMYVGSPIATAVTLTAYDASGDVLSGADTEHTVAGDHVTTKLRVNEATPDIAYWHLAPANDCCETATEMYVDDVSFDDPASSGGPDFSLAIGSPGGFNPNGSVTLNAGFSGTVGLLVTRVNGSTGPIDYTVTGLPAGISHSFIPASSTGSNSVVLKLTAPNDAAPVSGATVKVSGHPSAASVGPAPRSVTFTLNVLGSYDARVTGIEVDQAQQGLLNFCNTIATCDGLAALPPPDANHTASYTATPFTDTAAELVRHHPTVARVFANIAKPAGTVVNGFAMQLFGTRNGQPLPGSPLIDSVGPPLTNAGDEPFVTYADRALPQGGFDFTLPQSWTSGTVTLKAVLIPPVVFLGSGPAECSQASCAENNSYTLTNVSYANTGAVYFDPVAMKTSSEPSPPPPWQVFKAPEEVMPLSTEGFVYPSYYDGLIDETGVHNQYADGSNDANSAGADLLEDWIDDHDSCAQRACTDITVGVNAAVARGDTRGKLTEGDQPYAVVEYDRPLTSVSHELSHAIGRVHADLTCGGNSNGQTGEAWPPDNAGKLDSIGFDVSSPFPPDPVKAPDAIAPGFGRPTDYYDFMSYCPGANESEAWVSTRGWNESFNDLLSSSHGVFPIADAARAHHRYLRVVAYVGGPLGTRIDHVRMGSTLPPPRSRLSVFKLTALSANGHVLASARMHEILTVQHNVRPPIELIGTIPMRPALAHVASVQIRFGGQRIAVRRRSPHAPVVKLIGVRAGQRIGTGKATTLRWRMHDADGKAPLVVGVQLSLDGGRTYRPIWEGLGAHSATIPSAMLGASRHARLRLRVSDGFNETEVVSPKLIAVPRPPVVAITLPAGTTSVASDGVLSLHGFATDDHGRRLRPRRLTWKLGDSVIGHGESVDRTGLPPGRRLVTLLATDAQGRTGHASVLVEVTPAPPRLLSVSAAPLPTGAGTVSLTVASSEPAFLFAGGQRFTVSRAPSTVQVPVDPVGDPVDLDLFLEAEGLVTEVPISVPRS
jgi:hypothetical protein